MRSYKSLGAWQEAHRLCIETLTATDQPSHPRVRVVFDQLRRAAVSVEVNIVEGYALGTKALFRRHIRIAIGSAAEVECLLNIAAERRYMAADIATTLTQVADRTIGVLFGLFRSPKLGMRR